MKILELFSGTGSFSKVSKERGHETFTVDCEDWHNPDLVKNILFLKKEEIPFKPDIIWASPPCQTFSVMSNFREWAFPIPRTSRAARHLGHVLKTLELIKELEPKHWFIENPRGLLRKFPFMEEINRRTVTYCQYGLDYMKPTDIWTSLLSWKPRKMCRNGDPCHVNAKRGSVKGIQGLKATYGFSKEDRALRSIVPRELCLEIIKCCEEAE